MLPIRYGLQKRVLLILAQESAIIKIEMEMRKIILCILLLFCYFCNLYSQEIFVDVNTQDTCLFIGGINLDDGKGLKVFTNGEITYKKPEDLIQVGLLLRDEFTDELFRQGLCFELSGYGPHWNVSIYKDILTVWISEFDRPKQYKVNLHIGKDLSSVFFAMFSTECGSIFGTINNMGLTLKEKCRICEYDLADPSLFEAYIYIDGNVNKGCANICAVSDKIF